jgi:uncharacterized protein (DUF885 family)
MHHLLRRLALALVVLVAVAAALALHTWYFRPLSIDWFYARSYWQTLLDSPETLTQLRLLEPYGIRAHNARLDDASEAHQDAVYARLRRNFAQLQGYDRARYSGQDRLSYDILHYQWTMQLRGERWRYHNHPISSYFGMQAALPDFLTQQHQINDAEDARHYIARLDGFRRKFEQTLEAVRLREQRGIVPPKFAVDKSLAQMREFVAAAPKDNVLVTVLAGKLDKLPPGTVDAATRAQLLAQAERAVADSVLPSYRAAIALFERLQAKATRDDGVWALPDGDAYYQYEIERNTTATLTADEIHRLGLQEVERIGREMDAILRAAGYTRGTLAERMRQLAASPGQQYADSDAGRAQILRDYQAIIDEMSAALPRAFATLPKAPVQVKRVEPFAENVAPSAYYQSASLDGTRPGVFFANLRDVKETPRFGMRTLAYHEGVPGHHLQGSIAQELQGLPLFRTLGSFTAYDEGWALYAERLAWELGFQSEPLSNLGRLRDEMLRAVRLVVDTGIHAKRWTREQAIDYMIAHTGMQQGETEGEIERYFLDPGQALAYKVGMLKILALREKARTALGARFDLREFHDVVLKNGALPLTVLEQVVGDYIARKQGG